MNRENNILNDLMFLQKTYPTSEDERKKNFT